MPSVESGKLYIEFQFPIAHENVAAALVPYGIAEFDFEVAGSGVENATIFVDSPQGKFALRVYRQAKKSTPEIELELEFASYLGAHGIPVPTVKPTNQGRLVAEVEVEGKSWQIVLMGFEPGVHPEGYDASLLAEMAGLQARMHLLGIDFSAKLSPRPKRAAELKPDSLVISLARPTDARLADMLERAKRHHVRLPTALPSGFSHYDFVDGNVLLSEGRISAVLDFDDARYAPVIICLANTLWSILSDSKDYENARTYVATYEKTRPLSSAEKQSIKGILLHRHYWICAMVVSFGQTSAKDIEGYLGMEQKVLSLPKL
jgi:Ser/Thr protein kinase RdoA (MazF antagonist)